MHLASPSSVKPDAPRLYPDVDFSEDEPLEATVHWAPPLWPPHNVMACQFYYRRCQGTAWTLVSVRDPPFSSLSSRQGPGHYPQIRNPAQDLFLTCSYDLSTSHTKGLYVHLVQLKNHPHHQII